MPDSDAHVDKLFVKMVQLESKLDEAKQERKLLQLGMLLATGGWPSLLFLLCFPFDNRGCPVLALFARAGTMLPRVPVWF